MNQKKVKYFAPTVAGFIHQGHLPIAGSEDSSSGHPCGMSWWSLHIRTAPWQLLGVLSTLEVDDRDAGEHGGCWKCSVLTTGFAMIPVFTSYGTMMN